MAEVPERRRHPRGKRLLRFEFTHGGGTVRALSANVSAGGAFLCANDLPPAGREIRARFLAGTDSARAVTIRALVMRAVPEPNATEPNRGIAVRWIEASSSGHPEAIEDFLSQFKGDPGGQILAPDDRNPDSQFRYIFPEPEPDPGDAVHDARGAIPMGNGATLPSGVLELSMQDFLVDDDDDDDDDGPPTQPIDAPPGGLDDLFADEDTEADDAASMEEFTLDLLDFEDDLPDVTVVGSDAAGGPPPFERMVPPDVTRSAIEPRTDDAQTTPRPPVAPPPQTVLQAAPAARPETYAPEPNDEDIGSGLVPVELPILLEWSGRSISARTTHLTETQLRLTVSGEPPSVYSRVAVVFPSSGRKNKPECVLRANVTRVRKSATGDGGLVTLRLAMQNEPSDLKAYRKIVKKASG